MQEKKVLNNFKSRLFPIKSLDKTSIRKPSREPTPDLATEKTNHKKSKLKLQQEFMNEIMVDEKDINGEIF